MGKEKDQPPPSTSKEEDEESEIESILKQASLYGNQGYQEKAIQSLESQLEKLQAGKTHGPDQIHAIGRLQLAIGRWRMAESQPEEALRLAFGVLELDDARLAADALVLHGAALLRLGHIRDAQDSLGAAARAGAPSAVVASLLARAEAAAFDRHYADMMAAQLELGADRVSVRRHAASSSSLGKYVAATRAVKAGEPLLVERPLVSQPSSSSSPSRPFCRCCLRAPLRQNDLDALGGRLAEILPPAAELSGDLAEKQADMCAQGERVGCVCALCGSAHNASPLPQPYYCSDTCRSLDWETGHRFLCVGQPEPLGSVARKLASLGGTHGQLVAKMLAACVGECVDEDGGDEPEQRVPRAFELFERFVGPEQPRPYDVEALECFRSLVLHPSRELSPNLAVALDQALSLSRWRRFHGVLTHNAHTLRPVSDVHERLLSDPFPNEILQKVGARLGYDSRLWTDRQQAVELMQHPELAQLCAVEAVGLFAITNCINHSCDPNAVVLSCFPDERVQLLALRDFAEQDEVFISYIDESLPRETRRSLLREHYSFDCSCSRCESENVESEID